MSKNEKRREIIFFWKGQEGQTVIGVKGSESRHSQKVHHIRHMVSTMPPVHRLIPVQIQCREFLPAGEGGTRGGGLLYG